MDITNYTEDQLAEMADKKVKYNGEMISMYDATQEQRKIERKIRYWKRIAGAQEAAEQDATKANMKVKQWQAKMKDFTDETGLIRQREREKVLY